MDLDILTKEQIIIERINVNASDCDNVLQIANDMMNTHHGYKHKDGFVRKLKKILSTKDLIVTKNYFDGSCHIDIIFLADVLAIDSGSILYGCKITMITEAGIFAQKENGLIKIVIPSDELTDIDFNSVYKKNDIINVELIASRSTIYDTEIIVYGRIYEYKITSKKLLIRKISNPIYISNVNTIDYVSESGNIDFSKLTVSTSLTISNKPTLYERLGYPTQHKLDIIKKLPDTISTHLDPFGSVPELLLKSHKEFDTSRHALEFLEILNIFNFNNHITDKKIRIAYHIFDKQISNAAYENISKIYFKGAQLTLNTIKNASGSQNIGIFITESNIQHLQIAKILLCLLKFKPDYGLIRLNNITDLFSLQVLCIIKNLYQNVWLYKPSISNGITLNTYIVSHNFNKSISDVNIKNLFASISSNVIKKLDKNTFATSFIDNMVMNDFANEFIISLRNFNTMQYYIYMEKHMEEYLHQNAKINKSINLQNEIAKTWISENTKI